MRAKRGGQVCAFVVKLQRIRSAKILCIGGGSAAVFTDKFGVADVVFIFFEIIFYESHIISHAQMGFMPLMRFRQMLGKWKPFSHFYTSCDF